MSKIDTFEKKIFPTASFPRSSGKAMTTENDLKVSNSYHSRRREAIMSAINPSTLETEFISPSFSVLKLKENSIDLDEDFLGSDLEDNLVSSPQKSYSNRTTTDLVRLYLQDIGRVPLLKRDEEVEQAQRVQRHLSLLELLQINYML